MNIYKKIESEVKAIVERLAASGALGMEAHSALPRIEATPTRDASHGDIATNAAMVLAAPLKAKPQEIASTLLKEIEKNELVARAEIAGPGFINLTLKPDAWQEMIPLILKEKLHFGDSGLGAGEKVNVEFVSANPTGPMHVGHGRGAVVGDALAGLLQKAGYAVTREYYINDAGAQVDKLAETAYLRYREALGEDIGAIPEGLYPGEYMKKVGLGLAAIHGDALIGLPREKWLAPVREFAVEANMAMIKDDLAALGVHHDVFSSERAMVESGKVEESIKALEDQGLIYTGVLEPPKGKAPEDWEPRPQTLFRSTAFGDDCDRALKKSDGSWTYLTPDIGYHYDKFRRGFSWLINVLGADHAGYVKRITAGVSALSGGKAKLDVKLCQMVKLMKGGEPFKMSKRAGNFVTVREVVDEVGAGVFRFIMLTRKSDQPIDFDFEKVMEQSKENPVFYVQYAHARARSVIRHARAEMPEAAALAEKPGAELLARLDAPSELSLLKRMAAWPRVVEQAALAGEPHRIAFYLHELASEFHAAWNAGNEQNQLRFLQKDDMNLTAARVALAEALSLTLASGLTLLGVEPLEEMR